MTIQEFDLEITPVLPEGLNRLEELANNLWYGWHIPTRILFEYLDADLWIRVGHNPKLFLRNVDQKRLQQAVNDPLFLNQYKQVLSTFDSYLQDTKPVGVGQKLQADDLIAYFCAEYGFHESLPVYSGGLGILAGDHCKSASDLRLPFVAVGLFYHRGYFNQLIDVEGNQHVSHHVPNPHHLPMHIVVDEHGNEIHVSVNIAGRSVWLKAWHVQVGHINLYLLDTKVPQNTPEDTEITFQLYGGDANTRIQQEIILGIGGLRMLRQLNIAPTVFHMNEGHAAFLILERLRELVKSGLPYTQALEMTASNSVFTTHTPVPAGHDHFPEHLVMHYLGGFAQDLGLSWEQFMALGRLHGDGPDFNMTTLAIQGSRKINGVSRIHGRVSSEICSKFWTEIRPEENPVDYVTNGVHVSSFLARQWSDLFDKHLGSEWRARLCDSAFWKRIEEVPDKEFWNVKQAVKSRMLVVVRNALISQHLRAQNSETHIESVLKNLDPDNPNVLTVGFARRFATYKRATLLLNDLERLRKILSVTDCPIVFIFAGKAHPADEPGKNLLRALYKLSNEPEFIGKIVVAQGYDMGLGRRLVSGVDVWLNNPVYPLEASGTSGMKAAINGAINLSITDGWWAEGYEGDNGWNIRPSPHQEDGRRDHEDARNLYDILENEVIPIYYDRDKRDYSTSWVEKSKRSMTSVIPRFNMVRMLNEYLEKFYIPAGLQGRRFSEDNFSKARQLADWKSKVRNLWKNVQVHLLTAPHKRLSYDEPVTIETAIKLNGLDPHDVAVELLLSRKLSQVDTGVMPNVSIKSSWESENQVPTVAYRFVPERPLDSGEYLYRLTFQPDWCGVLKFKVRVFPFHELLTDPHEMGMMVWA